MKYLINKAKGFTLVELMVVIVIVGILAAVAIPKFLDASHKAKASEFPTVLSSIYSAEQAQQAETGLYASDLTALNTAGTAAIPSTTTWFNYAATGDASTFAGTATVAKPFGIATTSDGGYIDQTGLKSASANLMKYAPNWK